MPTITQLKNSFYTEFKKELKRKSKNPRFKTWVFPYCAYQNLAFTYFYPQQYEKQGRHHCHNANIIRFDQIPKGDTVYIAGILFQSPWVSF